MAEPTKVYLVHLDEYDEYSPPLGVFSTREKAEAAMALRPDLKWEEPQEVTLDSLTEIVPEHWEVGPVFEVRIRVKDGLMAPEEATWKAARNPAGCWIQQLPVGKTCEFLAVQSPISFDEARREATLAVVLQREIDREARKLGRRWSKDRNQVSR